MLFFMHARSGQPLLQSRIARYAFSLAAVTGAFALKLWLIPLTGRGAPFVVFFAAVMGQTSAFHRDVFPQDRDEGRREDVVGGFRGDQSVVGRHRAVSSASSG